MNAAALPRIVDHTLLQPTATRAEVEAAIAEAAALGAYSVCLSPSMVPVEMPEGLKLAVVVGFPSGKHHSEIKAAEARLAASHGVDEIDMVIDVGAAIEGRFDAVEADVRAVREAAPDVVLKVIIESAALSDEAIVGASRAAEAAGADFVKTSTGFHPSGGASAHAVRLMKETVGDRLEVKASGGIRSHDDAEAMTAAGATRLGLSSTRAIVEGAEPAGSY
ncbi:deoxyribose-phosphate aldolase [Agrococcus sp. SL85]|uniref:deoxyribose-phosphate aldolase n=1 Tax=Agrococcus sp. SL85 TaxID=2995141 RepID=UPI00226CE4DE|nr:deoxyribose-phosphate aldolase [Agrococcus sp. SL85]WAC66524.1 deoxyribose-phosphate aldolase [Agrococcus sp. SL85]